MRLRLSIVMLRRSLIALLVLLALRCGAPEPRPTSTGPTDTGTLDTAATTIDTDTSATTVTTATTTSTILLPPTNEAQLQEQLNREFQDLNPARHAWNPPTSAKLYKRVLVTYRIAPKGTPGDVAANLPGGGPAETFQSNISQRVKVQLAGPAFDIDPKEPVAQTLAPGQPSEWSWWVTPNESGAQTLQLKSWLVLKAAGADQEVPLPPRFHQVDVRFNLIGWMALHWQLLASAILIPFGGWACKEAWQRMRRGTGGASTTPHDS